MKHKELQKYLGILPEKRRPQLRRLGTHHKQAIMLHLEGMPASQIADELGRTPGWVSETLRSDLAQALINDYLSFADSEFKALYKLSIAAIRDALQSQDPELKLKAADKYLKAHGKYDPKSLGGKETAEDVIKRVMELKITEVYPAEQSSASSAKPQHDENRVVDLGPTLSKAVEQSSTKAQSDGS